MRVPQLATHYMIDDEEHLAVGKSIKSPYRHYNCYCWAATHDFAHSERSAWIRLCSWNGESNEDKKRQIESQLKPWHNRGNFHRLHQQRSIHLIKPMIRVTCQANMCMHLQNRECNNWKCSMTQQSWNMHRMHEQRYPFTWSSQLINVTCQAWTCVCICKTELQHENVPEPGWYARMFDRISSGPSSKVLHSPDRAWYVSSCQAMYMHYAKRSCNMKMFLNHADMQECFQVFALRPCIMYMRLNGSTANAKNRHVRSMTIQYHCFQKTQLLSHKSATSAASLLATSISQYIV